MLRLASTLPGCAMVVLSACGDTAVGTIADTDPSSTTAEQPTPSTSPEPTSGPDLPEPDPPDLPTTSHSDTSGPHEPKPPKCGNFEVEGDEQCDDGFDANLDENPCKSDCMRAFCGDGHVQAALGEICDHGDANARVPKYDGCDLHCQRGPHCGDSMVQPDADEECEPGRDSLKPASCKLDCSYTRRIVFLSQQPFVPAAGGLKHADATCDAQARAAGLAGSFKAWLLVDDQTLAARLPEYPDFTEPFVFVTAANAPLAVGLQQLIDDGPNHAITTLDWQNPVYKAIVWTNITPDGIAAGGDCDGWTSAEGNALVGHSGYQVEDPDADPYKSWVTNRHWTSIGSTHGCINAGFHIYCIQLPD